MAAVGRFNQIILPGWIHRRRDLGTVSINGKVFVLGSFCSKAQKPFISKGKQTDSPDKCWPP
jgi:hypothetical protein